MDTQAERARLNKLVTELILDSERERSRSGPSRRFIALNSAISRIEECIARVSVPGGVEQQWAQSGSINAAIVAGDAMRVMRLSVVYSPLYLMEIMLRQVGSWHVVAPPRGIDLLTF